MDNTWYETKSTEQAESSCELPGSQIFLDNLLVWPVFQPIVDLYQGTPLGYEILSRSREPLADPNKFLTKSDELGVRWETESTCRTTALETIYNLGNLRSRTRFFFNISSPVLHDPRLLDELSIDKILSGGINPEQVILEVTGTPHDTDSTNFQEIILCLREMGFGIAIDDFDYGNTGLNSMICAKPDYIKLDRSITNQLHKDPVRLKMVRAILHLCEDMNVRMIAKGVEHKEELELLSEIGVRYAQGFYLSRPRVRPSDIEESALNTLHEINHRLRKRHSSSESITDIMRLPPIFESGSLCGEELDHLLRKNAIDHAVMLEGKKPVGLITKNHFSASSSGAFGYSLLQKRPAEKAAKQDILCVREDISTVELSKMAMQRPSDDVYDPVVIVDHKGNFVGTVEMRMLILRSSRLEVDIARDSNPLTSLPGNRCVQQWLQQSLDGGDFCVVYYDLNKFKEYNDVYGFSCGDDMIRLVGEVLKKYEDIISPTGKLGHIGGDDFVFITTGQANPEALDEVMRIFDQEKRCLFKAEHVQAGGYEAKDRQGNTVWVPLCSLSASAVSSDAFRFTPHPSELAKAAATLKKLTKEDCKLAGKSCCRFERRIYNCQDEV